MTHASQAARLDDVAVVLCRPQGAQNVGAVARSMANFGLSDLRIVSPRQTVTDEWGDGKIVENYAVFATDVLDSTRFYEELREAVGDCGIVLGTGATSRKGLVALSPGAAADLMRQTLEENEEGGDDDDGDEASSSSSSSKVALVLGNERFGLSTEEVRLCSHTINIQTDVPSKTKNKSTGDHSRSSLNLSHAAAIFFYEIFRSFKRSSGDLREVPEQSTKPAKAMPLRAKMELKDLLFRCRRSLDVGDAIAEHQLKDDEESLLSLVARNALSARDASVLFQIGKRVEALCGGSEGSALGGLLAAEMDVENGVASSLKQVAPNLSLSKEELRWLEAELARRRGEESELA